MAGSAIRVNALVVRQQIRRMQQIVNSSNSAMPEIKNNSGETANRLKEIFEVCKMVEADFRKLIADTATAMTSALAEFEGADSSLAGLFASGLTGVAGAIGSVRVDNPRGRIRSSHSAISDISSQIGRIEHHQITPGTIVTAEWANKVFSKTGGIGVKLESIASAIGHVSVEVGELIDPHIHLSRDLLDFFENHTFDVQSFIGTSDAELDEPTFPLWPLIILPVVFPVHFFLNDTSLETLRRAAVRIARTLTTIPLAGNGSEVTIEDNLQTSVLSGAVGSVADSAMKNPPELQKGAVQVVRDCLKQDPNGDPLRRISGYRPGIGSIVLSRSRRQILYVHKNGSYIGKSSARAAACSVAAARAAEQVMRSAEYASGEIGSRPTLGIA